MTDQTTDTSADQGTATGSAAIAPYYDVIIMGGGPAGSTLASQLRRTSDLSVVIIEKEVHPREHIGESLAHPTTPAMEEIGVLQKVLDSDVWVKKFGGIFNWDAEPSVGFFDHDSFLQDGAQRWTAHVNRSEFDHLLLQHAESLGTDVFQGISVLAFERTADGCEVTLRDGTTVRGQYFVDASGRRNSIASKSKRQWLSTYKNIAIWQHYENCKSSYEIEGDWNIFAERQQSSITCSAFDDGWCWYIPVRKEVDGKRVETHSVGIVTIPAILKEEGKDYTDPAVFFDKIRTIPMIGDLITDEAKPISDTMSTATNYSMINDTFCNFDERWILVGDAAYFVDPLFSSGVAFAMGHGLSAALLIKTSADKSISDSDKRDLWQDYDREWHGIAQSFSLAIDQWYYAIGKNNPDSVYWHSRGNNVDLDIREGTFQLLLSTSLEPDLLRVLTSADGTQEDLDRDGPYMQAFAQADAERPNADDLVAPAPGATMRASLGLDIPGFKGFAPPPEFPIDPADRAAIGRYWADPVRNGHEVESPLSAAVPCHRFAVPGSDVEVRSIEERDGGAALWAQLTAGPVTYGELAGRLDPVQLGLLGLLARAGLVTVTPAAQLAVSA